MNRQDWYLASLGVVRYVPRGSVAAVEEEPIVPATPVTNVAVSPPAQAGRAALHQVMAEAEPPRARVSEPATSAGAQVTSPQAATETETPVTGLVAEPVTFRLAVWQPVPDLLFFDSLPPGEQPSATMAKLVTNIAAALGRVVDGVAAPQLIDWPPARGRPEGDLEAARAMTSAFCDARLPPGEVSLVLLMGEDAVRLLLPADTDYAAALAHTRRWRELEAVVTPALVDLLQDPAAKRRVWQAIAPFARRHIDGG